MKGNGVSVVLHNWILSDNQNNYKVECKVTNIEYKWKITMYLFNFIVEFYENKNNYKLEY